MKFKKTGILILSIVIISLLLSGFSGIQYSPDNMSDSIISKLTNLQAHDENVLFEEMNIKLETITTKDIITEEEALLVANSQVGEEIVSEADKIHVTKHIMTLNNFRRFSQEALNANPILKNKGYIDNMPVWLVTYKGLSLTAHGKIGNETKPNTELVVVIDAISSQPLLMFRYR